jgi:MarR family transcriptional regulator for hemolysin
MLQYDFQSSIGYWICLSARHFERAMNQELTPEGITYRQCQVLGWLALEGTLSQVELAERMNIEPPTLVRILDRMERDGLLLRDTCPEDARRKMIRPLTRVRERATSGMTDEEITLLKELLRKVQTNLPIETMHAAAAE